MNTKEKNNTLNKWFAVIVAVLLLLAIVSPIAYIMQNNRTVAAAAPADAPPEVSTQAVNDAEKDISFELKSEEEVNEENFRDYVQITDIAGVYPAYKFEQGAEGRFKISAPDDGYEEGVTYKIELFNARFVSEEMDSENTFYFTIKRPQTADVRLKENVKQIAEKIETEFFDENSIRLTGLNGLKYSTGDILIVPVHNDEFSEISLKIDQIISQTANEITFVYKLPQEGEVAGHADMYYNQDIEYSQEMFSEEFEEEVKRNILQTDYVRDMDEVVNTVYNAKNRLPEFVAVIPKVKVSVKDYNPLDMKIELTWTSANIKARSNCVKDTVTGKWMTVQPKNTPDLEVKVEIGFINKTKSFASEKKGIRNTSAVNTSTTMLKVSLGAEYKAEVLGEISKKYQQAKYDRENDNFNKTMQPYLDEASRQIEERKRPGDYTGDGYGGRGRPTKELQERIAKENAAIDLSNLKINAAREFIKNNGQKPEKSEKEIFNYKTPPIALGTPAVTFAFEIGMFFDIQINAEIGTQHIWKTTVESGTIEHNGKTENYHNEIKEYTGNVNINGTLEAKVGVRTKGYFTFIGIVQLGVKAEIGLYFEAGGMYSKAWGDGYVNGVYNPDLGIDNPRYDAKPWAAYVDVGWYFNFTGYARFLTFKPWEYTFFKEEKSFFGEKEAIGKRFMYDLISKAKQLIGAEGTINDPKDLDTIIINENGYGEMPALYKQVYKIMENELTVSDQPLSPDEYVIGFSNYVYFKDGMVYVKDSSVQSFYDVVHAYLIVDGEVDENSCFPIVIRKDPVKVESITAYSGSEGVQVGEKINLLSKCEPFNASYTDSEFTLDYVIKDGLRIDGDLEQFAEIDALNMLSVKNTLNIGDKVAVKAHAIADDVWSQPFEIPVIKIPVQEICVVAEDFVRSIGAGERVEVFPRIYPSEASFPVEDVYISSGEDCGKIIFEGGRYFVECFEGTELGKTIGVTAAADEGDAVSDEYIFTVGAVAVEKIEIADELGNKLLDRKVDLNKIEQGASIKLKAVFTPYNATVTKCEYHLIEGDAAAAIDGQGNLTVNKRAKIGTTVTVLATAEGVNSNAYSFEVVKIPVDKIELKNYQNTVTVKPGGTVQFYPVVTPADATYISPVYTITEGGDMAQISAYGTLTVFQYAEIGRVIRIAASTDGVISETFTLTVEPILAESIQLFAGKDTLWEGEGLQLDFSINPITASYADQIAFEIVEGGQYASVNEYGYLQINDTVPAANGAVKVKATLDGVSSNICSFNIYVPVKKAEILFDSGEVGEMQVYMSERFSAVVSPSYATYARDVQYLVTNNPQFVTLSEGVGGYYVTVNEGAVVGDKFSIAVVADGVRSADYFITIVKTPVERINVTDNNMSVGEGKTVTLNASVYPLSATYGEISYRISEGFEIADIVALPDGRFALQVRGGADKIGKTIKVIACADGLESEPIVFTVVKNAVNSVKIFDSLSKTVIRPDETAQILYEVNADATFTSAVYRITAGSEYATLSDDGKLTINETILIPNSRVSVAVTVDGTESGEWTYDIFVPVSEVYLNADCLNPRVGSILNITAGVNKNATDKSVSLEVLSGGEYLENISSDTYGNASYRVKDNVKKPDAAATFKASAQGVESYELSVNLVAPVTEVTVACVNTEPRQGDTVYVYGAAYPSYATYLDITYKLTSAVSGVYVNPHTGAVEVDASVKVGTVFGVVAAADGIESEALQFTVRKVAVSEVAVKEVNGLTEVRVGESVQLTAAVYPLNATYKEVTWLIVENGAGVTIDANGKVEISLAAAVGAVVRIKATADNVDSDIYEITLLKQPVTGVHLEYDAQNSYGENLFLAGSMVKLFASINENATYPDIVFGFTDERYIEYSALGAKIGDVQEFIFKIKDYIDIPNAFITCYAEADGVRSKLLTIDIYNPVKSVEIELTDNEKITAESDLIFKVGTNDGHNNSTATPQFIIVQGGEYLNETGYGRYRVKTLEELSTLLAANPNRDKTIAVKAKGDGVDSNIIYLQLYVSVDRVEFTKIPEYIKIGGEDIVNARALPEYASERAVTYSITNQTELPFATIDSVTGRLSVQNNRAYVGKDLVIRATAENDIFAQSRVEVRKVDLLGIAVTDSATEAMPGAQVKLYSTPTPFNATFGDNLKDVRYFVRSGEAVVRGNVLTVRSTAPIGSKIILYAEVQDGSPDEIVTSEDYVITVSGAPETAVRLYAQDNISDVLGGQQLRFFVDVQLPRPDTGPDFPVTFSVEGPASITWDGLLTIDSGAENNAAVIVRAEAVGVVKTVALTVKVPVTARQSKTVLKEGESDYLELDQAELFSDVNFYVASDSAHLCSIDENTGKITVSAGVKGNSVINAYAVADGVKSDTLSWTIFVPVGNLTLEVSNNTVCSYTTYGLTQDNADSRIGLNAAFNKQFASNISVRYRINSGYDFVRNRRYENGHYYIYDDYMQVIEKVNGSGNTIVLQAEVYGIYDQSTFSPNTETIAISIPVESVTLTRASVGAASGSLYVRQGMSYTFNAAVYPAYADNSNITFTTDSTVATVEKRGNQAVLAVNSNAVLDKSFKLTAYVRNGRSAEYSLTVEKVWADELSYSLQSARNNGSWAVLSKVYAGDTLTAIFEYSPMNVSGVNKNAVLSFSSSSVITSNSYAVISGNKVYVNSVANLRDNSPSFVLYAWSTKKDGSKTLLASKTINVYVPVVDARVSLTTVDRGENNYYNIKYNEINGGYANPSAKSVTVKKYSVTTSLGESVKDSTLDFTLDYVKVPQYFAAGTTISGTFVTPDGIEINFKFTVKALELSADNIFYSEKANTYSTSSSDCSGRKMYSSDSAQLEEGCSTYVLGRYGSGLLSSYGVTYNVSTNDSYAKISGTLLSINKNTAGNKTVTLICKITDGDNETTVTKSIKVYNAVSGAYIVNEVTSKTANLRVSKNDSLASHSTDSYSFAAEDNDNYSLSASGNLTVKNKAVNHTNIDVGIYYYQTYNGVRNRVLSVICPCYINIKSSYKTEYSSNVTITDDNDYSYRQTIYPYLNIKELKEYGYNKIKITIIFDVAEINDGFQDIRIYSGDDSNRIGDTTIEHGAGKKDTSTGAHTVEFTVSMDSFKTNTAEFYIGWGAHGGLDDDWSLGKRNITVEAL